MMFTHLLAGSVGVGCELLTCEKRFDIDESDGTRLKGKTGTRRGAASLIVACATRVCRLNPGPLYSTPANIVV